MLSKFIHWPVLWIIGRQELYVLCLFLFPKIKKKGLSRMIVINNVTKNHIIEADYICLDITKQEVKNINLRRARQTLKAFEDTGKQGKNKLIIGFKGYENTSKDIYEIKEIRKYAKKLFDEFPHIFYFLSNVVYSRTAFLHCLYDENAVRRISPLNVAIVPSEYSEYINRKVIDGILDYGTKIGESETELWQLIDEVLRLKRNTELFKILSELTRVNK